MDAKMTVVDTKSRPKTQEPSPEAVAAADARVREAVVELADLVCSLSASARPAIATSGWRSMPTFDSFA
jgi:hypothetical protein